MGKVVLFPNKTRDPDFAVTSRVRALLEQNGCHLVCVPEAAVPGLPCESPRDAAKDAAFAVCIGGDGTLLRAVSLDGVGELPIAGVNTGHKGYLAQYEPDDPGGLAQLARGQYHLSRRLMLRAEYTDDMGKAHCVDALNDIVFSRGDAAQTITLDVRADGQALGSFRADGLLVATPTGSTAYNLSAGGPVTDTEMDALIVTPICPHTIWARSFVLDARRCVTVTALRHAAHLSADGEGSVCLREGDSVMVRRSPRVALLIAPEGVPALRDVKSKLIW